jgi:hypothetical protein
MVGLIILIALTALLLGSLVWIWIGGIDYMAKNHPKYKGEEFFNEEDKNEIL